MEKIKLFFVLSIFSVSFSFSAKSMAVDDALKLVDQAHYHLSKMTLRQKIAQFFMVAAYSNKDSGHLLELKNQVSEEGIGGLIFFQGEEENMKSIISDLQSISKTPLLIGIDAEWGLDMRLIGKDRFPYNYTIGAANDPLLTKKISKYIAQECLSAGIKINFAPVADVNSNPSNPVIGFRSFGANSTIVSNHVEAFVQGHEENGVLSCVKHFPGHGDTYLDSHLELPVITNSKEYIEKNDFPPFRKGIVAGTSSIMIGHLSVPSLDSTNTPATLSSEMIRNELIGNFGFEGLIISDALNMKAVSDKYGKSEVAVKAFLAGCDILLFPEDVENSIQEIVDEVENGTISKEEIDLRCLKILRAKFKKTKISHKSSDVEIEATKKMVYEKAITVLKNENGLPIQHFDQKIACMSIGVHVDPLWESMDLVGPVDYYHAYTGEEAIERYKKLMMEYDVVITSIHANSVRVREGFSFPSAWEEWVKSIDRSKKQILLIAGNPLVLKDNDVIDYTDAVVTSYENHKFSLDRLGQFIMGTFSSTGKLPIEISSEMPAGFGIDVPWAGRLKYGTPEEFGISREKLSMIDTMVNQSINDGVFPGCQIVVAHKGVIVYQKEFGYHTYDSIIPIELNTLYDIASVTKIVSSTASLMHLQSNDKFSLDDRLGEYLSELTDSTAYDNMRVKSMLSHQAGLYPWIPFYTKTMVDKSPSTTIYKNEKKDSYTNRVTSNLFMDTNYVDVMYNRILSTRVKGSTYKYSDLGYYFFKKVIEKQSGLRLEDFVNETFYKPLGLRTMGYNPIDRFPLSQIAPTEDDKVFRQELIQGYVHDQGAAMMGGVCGHAGIFSNATDLASMMQLFLNKGVVGGKSYFTSSVTDEYTGCQYCPRNRRGAGFDKPVRSLNGGPTCGLVSLSSFGHSGFTGTYAWADPKYDINYVFLSNRVYPDAENWKITKTGIRTKIQRVIYEAIKEADRP